MIAEPDFLDFSTAAGRRWDVILVGSSFASLFFAHALPDDLDILIVEKGAFQSHDRFIRNGWGTREQITQRNSSGYRKDWVAFTTFGGNSNFWWGDTPRFHPDDFLLRSKFGVGEDWPFGYDELEPYWARVENLFEVAGGGSEHVLPRKTAFPFPPHIPSRSDLALRASSDLWVPLPSARSNGGTRPQCCVNGVCGVCPVDAKFTSLNGYDRLRHPRARILLDTDVRAVEIEGGRARSIVARNGAAEHRISGDVIGLGANAIFNASILLRSDIRSESLGRYLHEQAPMDYFVDCASISNFFGGTSETGHGYHFYHDIDRSSAAAVMIENVNMPVQIRPEPGRWTNRLHLRLVAEDLPQPQNRVLLEDDEPVVEWTGHHDYAFRGLQRAAERLPEIIPDHIDRITDNGLNPSEAHIQGTHKIGSDPATSVVDQYMRVHGVDNLFALGAGAFPTCSPANCSLTLSAMSLRAAEVVS